MTQTEALTQSLVLAITAPTDNQANMAGELAERIAHGLTVEAVKQCQADALDFLGVEQ